MRIFCFDISFIGFKRKEWENIALSGDKVKAILSLRAMKNKNYPNVDDPRRLGLKDAKDIVEAYMWKHKIV